MYILPEPLYRAILILGRLKVWNFSARSRRSRLVSLGISDYLQFRQSGALYRLAAAIQHVEEGSITARLPERPPAVQLAPGLAGVSAGRRRLHPAWSDSSSSNLLP